MSSNEYNPLVPKSTGPSASEINLLDYWRVLMKRRGIIMTVVGVVTVIAIIYSLLVPKVYMSSATIMPVSGGGGGGLAAMAAQLGGLPFLGGLGGVADTPTQKFMALLRSQTLAEDIVNEFDLMKVFFEGDWDKKAGKWKTDDPKKLPSMEKAIVVLTEGHVQFADNKKEGTIKISAMFRDPERAADVANGYLNGLQRLINNSAFTVAKRNRIFIENRLARNKKELLEAGRELNDFYRDGRVSSVESVVDVPITVSEAYDFGTSEMNEEDLDKLEKEKNEIEDKIGVITKETSILIKDVPQQVYLQYLTLRSEVLGKMNALLAQQYEMAKIDEAKEDLAFQVIDRARVPEKRFKPERRKIVMLAFFVSLFITVFFMFIMEYFEKIREINKQKAE